MKRFLIFILLVFTGCAMKQPPPTLSWQDSNPLVPACAGVLIKNCKDNYTLTDETTEAVWTIPIGMTSFDTPSAQSGLNIYEIVVNGYDNAGNPITSPPATTTLNY